MACNLELTVTNLNIGWMDLQVHYRLWVAKSENEARAAGYNRKEPLLLWKCTNKFIGDTTGRP